MLTDSFMIRTVLIGVATILAPVVQSDTGFKKLVAKQVMSV